jgi:UDP-N-acetylglucosamine acyltransferase
VIINSIHASAQLIGDVTLGTGNTIGPLVVIIGPVRIGDNNWIGTGSVIGAPPEVRDWPHPRDAAALSSGRGIDIGDGNIIREHVQIHQGWHEITRVANETFIMNQCYLAHDSQVEDSVTLASSVLLAGHVRIGTAANLGLGTSVHQRRYIGDGVMIGMGSVVTRDVPPFSRAFGNPARLHGANRVGMRRLGIPDATIDSVQRAYERVVDDDSIRALGGQPGLETAVEKWINFGRLDR